MQKAGFLLSRLVVPVNFVNEPHHEKACYGISENKGEYQMRGLAPLLSLHSRTPLRSKSEVSSLYPSAVVVQRGLCWDWSKPQIQVFFRCGS